MMLSWGLDMDTHSHFRRYLDVFINKRRVSKNLKAFAMDPSARIYLQNWYANAGYGMFNELRVSLPNRVMGGGDHSIITYKFTHLSIPVLIEELHPRVSNTVQHASRKATKQGPISVVES